MNSFENKLCLWQIKIMTHYYKKLRSGNESVVYVVISLYEQSSHYHQIVTLVDMWPRYYKRIPFLSNFRTLTSSVNLGRSTNIWHISQYFIHCIPTGSCLLNLKPYYEKHQIHFFNTNYTRTWYCHVQPQITFFFSAGGIVEIVIKTLFRVFIYFVYIWWIIIIGIFFLLQFHFWNQIIILEKPPLFLFEHVHVFIHSHAYYGLIETIVEQ